MRKRLGYFTLPLVFLVCFSGCSKRSQCPSYWDSDPEMLFGEKPVLEVLKERTMPDETKNKEKAKLKKGYNKRARKRNARLFKKRRVRDLGKKNKRKKKHKATPGSGNH